MLSAMGKYRNNLEIVAALETLKKKSLVNSTGVIITSLPICILNLLIFLH